MRRAISPTLGVGSGAGTPLEFRYSFSSVVSAPSLSSSQLSRIAANTSSAALSSNTVSSVGLLGIAGGSTAALVVSVAGLGRFFFGISLSAPRRESSSFTGLATRCQFLNRSLCVANCLYRWTVRCGKSGQFSSSHSDHFLPSALTFSLAMLSSSPVVYRGHIANHILHREHGIGAWKLLQLTPSTIGKFRDRLRSAGVSVPTTRKVLATLHGVLEHAISQDWIATNAARNVKVIGPRGEGSTRIVPPSRMTCGR